jgi:hypothetical protein
LDGQLFLFIVTVHRHHVGPAKPNPHGAGVRSPLRGMRGMGVARVGMGE